MIAPHTLVAACALDLVAGDPEWLPHPVRLIGRGIATGERFVRTFAVSSRSELIGGALLSAAVVGASYLSARALIEASRRIDARFGWLVEVVLAWTTLAMRNLDAEARTVVNALDANDLTMARARLSRIVGRDTANLGEQQVARAAIETVAESTCDGIIAPLCYLVIGGVPLAFAYKAISTLDSMIGHKEHPYFYFGRTAARTDDAANYLPARLTALLLIASSRLHGADAAGAWQVWQRDGNKHASPNAGHSEAALAGALRVRLGGTNRYDGIEKQTPELNAECELPTRQAARQSLRLALTASLLGCALAIALRSIQTATANKRT